MLTKIVAQLKTGSVKAVVPFGSNTPPNGPYTVVKPEAATGGRRFRIIAHFPKGHVEALEDYIREAIGLLSEFQAASRNGAVNRLSRLEQYQDVSVGNDDGTISMEAAFLMPTHTF